MNITALGPEGTNGHEAAKLASSRLGAVYGSIEFCDTNTEVLEKAASQGCLGIVPVENSTAELVKDVIRDFWLKQEGQPPLHVIGEIQLPVEHHLVVHPSSDIAAGVTSIISHQQALDQCRDTLKEEFGAIPTSPVKSTALAARMVGSDSAFRNAAALSSRFAAEIYGLKMLREHMEDYAGNATRFHLVGPEPCLPTGKDRTAILFRVKDRPRSLVDVLWSIGTEDVNMSSVHSISLGSPGEYAFYVEFGSHVESDVGRDIMKRIRTSVDWLLVLGSYPRMSATHQGEDACKQK